MDTTAPTDVAQINPHFKTTGPTNAQSLADDLVAALDTYVPVTTEIRVTMYDAEGPPPHYPLGEAVRDAGVAVSVTVNRDVALALSYWAGTNRPRRRGRLYMPVPLLSISPSSANANTAALTKVAAFVPILTGLGGVNVDWVVWSRVDKQAHSVTNWSVNNAWDTQRRRGGAATTAQTGATGESGFPRVRRLGFSEGQISDEEYQRRFEEENPDARLVYS